MFAQAALEFAEWELHAPADMLPPDAGDGDIELREHINDECPGCLEVFVPNVTRVMMYACGHDVHPGCELMWRQPRNNAGEQRQRHFVEPFQFYGHHTCMICRQLSRPVLQTFRPHPDDYEVEGSDSEASMGGGDLQPVAFNGVVGLNELGR